MPIRPLAGNKLMKDDALWSLAGMQIKVFFLFFGRVEGGMGSLANDSWEILGRSL